MKNLCIPAEEPYREAVLLFFNDYLLHNRDYFWIAIHPLKDTLMKVGEEKTKYKIMNLQT